VLIHHAEKKKTYFCYYREDLELKNLRVKPKGASRRKNMGRPEAPSSKYRSRWTHKKAVRNCPGALRNPENSVIPMIKRGGAEFGGWIWQSVLAVAGGRGLSAFDAGREPSAGPRNSGKDVLT